MRVGLIHNGEAGSATGVDELVAMLSRHGHTVGAVATMADGLAALPLTAVDLVAAAGGDGTVGAVAASVRDPRLPIAVLPIGTANNIATSLGIAVDLDEAIGAWATSRVQPLDIGVATGPWGERRFVESVGGGLVSHGIAVMDRQPWHAEARPDVRLGRARGCHADLLDEIALVDWAVEIDGAAHVLPLLLFEALNTGLIGPNLALADASPFDGRLTVVAAYAEHREALQTWLRQDPRTTPPALPTWQAREITITRADRLHVDDTVVDGGDVRLCLDAGAVGVLVP